METLAKFDILKGPYYTRSKYLKLIDRKVAEADAAQKVTAAAAIALGVMRERYKMKTRALAGLWG